MTQNLHDDNDLPKFIHIPGSGDPGIWMATIFPDPESEESALSPAWIPSHLKEKWVNKDRNEPDHLLEPWNRPPDDEANRSEGLQKTITEISDDADVEAGLPLISHYGTGSAIVVNQQGEIKRKQRHLFATPATSEASKEYRTRVDDDAAYVYMLHGLESER
ncbi:uncharacterized protein EI90DRAFT_3126532 [Cantharellus anzutake]|uniref:uncharacterized protein n=1 Tax=Cantharellus anzutake TaxID=1750568 RepID=UPI001906FF5C|nr:uncharacterized protein EI90DRAFT_3126532 [Cantharellus anzutake]KAF8327876.1 hypothetical protein EI90DRAFT_3126532 [Cantharellus anzutake]